jgi:hypothetical protein
MKKTFDLETQCPRLPVPQLNDTLNIYLKSLVPLTSEEEYKEVDGIVKNFQATVGPILQKRLVERCVIVGEKQRVILLGSIDSVIFILSFILSSHFFLSCLLSFFLFSFFLACADSVEISASSTVGWTNGGHATPTWSMLAFTLTPSSFVRIL